MYWNHLNTVSILTGFIIMSLTSGKNPLQNPTISTDQSSSPKSDTLLANDLFTKAATFHQQERLDSAIFYYQKAAGTYQKENMTGKWIECQTKIGLALWKSTRFGESLSILDSTLAIATEFYGEDHPKLLPIMYVTGTNYADTKAFDKPLNIFNKALQIARKAYGAKHEEIIACYDRLGITYSLMEDFETSAKYYRMALNAIDSFDEVSDAVKIKVYNNINYNFGKMAEYDSTIYYTKMVVGMVENIRGKGHPSLYGYYSNLGNAYFRKGEYQEAISYVQAGVDLLIANSDDPSTDFRLARMYEVFGNVYLAMKEYEKAEQYYNRVLNIRDRLKGDWRESYAKTYNNLGLVYDGWQKPQLAEKYYQKALELKKEVYGDSSRLVTSTLSNIGDFFYHQDQPDSAEYYYNKCLELRQKIYSPIHPEVASVFHKLGNVDLMRNEPVASLEYFKMALESLIPGFQSTETLTNPDLTNRVGDLLLLRVLNDKAYVLRILSDEKKDKSYLKSSLKTYQLALDLMDSIRTGYLTRESKEILLQRYHEMFEGALYTLWKLLSVENSEENYALAYEIMERGRYTLLIESMKEKEARYLSGIPEEILARERELSRKIASLKQTIFNESEKAHDIDSNKIIETRNKLFDLQRIYHDSLLQHIEARYPQYYKFKYDLTTAYFADVRNYLKDQEGGLLEYHVGDTAMYILYVSGNSQSLVFQPITDSIRLLFDEFPKLITTFPDSQIKNGAENSLHEFIASSLLLLEILIPEEVFRDPIRRMIIVPHSSLAFIPFGLLIRKKAETNTYNYRNLGYLIQDYSISYAFSSTILLQPRRKVRFDRDYAGFAPVFSENEYEPVPTYLKLFPGFQRDDPISSLPYSEYEIIESEEIIGGERYLRNDATKLNFLDRAEKTRILHIATHAVVNEQDPLYSGLIFSKRDGDNTYEALYASELILLDLTSDLAVLSACNTGFGKFQKGEGVMSLSRAFASAGCPTSVMSLWEVNDLPASNIVISFFENLKTGMAKDAALRQAKLKYLESVTDQSLAHPFYWGSLVLIGDISPISWSSNWILPPVFLILIILGIIAGIVILRKPRQTT